MPTSCSEHEEDALQFSAKHAQWGTFWANYFRCRFRLRRVLVRKVPIEKHEPRVMTSLLISYPPTSISKRFFSMQIFKFHRQSCKLFFLFPPRRACSCSRWNLTYMMKPRISSSCVLTTKSFVVVFVAVLQPRRSTSFSRIDFQRSCQHRICHRSIEKSGRK